MLEARDIDDLIFRAFTEGFRVLEHIADPRGVMFLKHSDYRVLKELVRRPSLFHAVGDTHRPGVALFMRMLELTYFPPETPRNDDCLMHTVHWEDFVWAVVTIPAKTRRFAERTAARAGLRLADGVPTVIDRAGTRQFPMNTKTVYTLESAPGTLGGVAGPDRLRELAAEENARIVEVERQWRHKHGRN